jgi:octaprenyl-diphosphate synthase
VLTGDFCLARAVFLAAEEGGFEAVSGLARAVTEMAEGEVLQLQKAGDLSCSFAEYLDVIDRKSAALIAWCAAAPAHAKGDFVAAEALSRYGRGVGVAFQITDDVLDYRADTGKDPGADLRQRKVTLPLLIALDRSPGLREILTARAPTEAELPELLDRVRRTGALEASLVEARRRADDAARALDALPDNDGRRALRALARYLVERSR